MGILSDPRYENANDVGLRLHQTVCIYKGRPVYVTNAEQRMRDPADLTLDCYDLVEGKNVGQVHSSDEDFEVKAFPLGYMNRATTAVYVSRMPARKQRQGLSPDNSYITPVGAVGERDRSLSMSRDILQSRALGDMILGNYPTLSEAYEKVRKTKVKSVAFGRKLLLTEDEVGLVKLHYFTMPIAMFSKDRFLLTDRFENYLPILKRHDVPCEIVEV